MSRKVFTADEVLTAEDVNSYLMDQTVMSFAGTAARGSAISSPVEGMTTFLEDTDTLQTWNGSAWAGVGGATLLVNQTFSSGSSVQINNVFSSLYNDYLFIISNVKTSSASFCQMRLSLSGTPATAAEYRINQIYWSSATLNGVQQLETGFKVADSGTTDIASGNSVFTLTNPGRALPTSQHFSLYSDPSATIGAGVHRLSTAYDGVTLLTGNTFTSGQIRIYGYRNA